MSNILSVKQKDNTLIKYEYLAMKKGIIVSFKLTKKVLDI